MSQGTVAGGSDRLYPRNWENVAHLRVFRAPAGDWDKVSTWRTDMTRKGWKLLKVSTEDDEIVAVFGKTRSAGS